MNSGNTNPSVLFSGTVWEQITDKFLVGAGNNFTAGSTGGALNSRYIPNGVVEAHTLTTNELPSHSHGLNEHAHDSNFILESNGAHAHPQRGYWSRNKYGYTTCEARSYVSGHPEEAGNMDSAGNHTHTLSGSLGTASGDTESIGGSESHNHSFTGIETSIDAVPPYYSVNIWKRIS